MEPDDELPPEPPPDLDEFDVSDDEAAIPDSLDLVVEADAMVAVFVARRFIRIDAMSRETSGTYASPPHF